MKIICIVLLLICTMISSYRREVPQEYIGKDVVFYYNKILEYEKKPINIVHENNRDVMRPTIKNYKHDLPVELTVDKANGYIEILENGGQSAYSDWTFVSCFFNKEKVPYILIHNRWYKNDRLRFLNPMGQDWIDVKDKTFPQFDYHDFLKNRNYKASEKIIKYINYYYEIPHFGTTLSIYLNKDSLNEIITDTAIEKGNPDYDPMYDRSVINDKEVVDQITEFIKNMKYSKIQVNWDINNSKFIKTNH